MPARSTTPPSVRSFPSGPAKYKAGASGQAPSGVGKIRTHTLAALKAKGERFAVLTAYDFGAASALEAAGVEVCLVGDSLGTVVLGYENTVAVTMEDMLHHAKAVKRGIKRAMLVVDMPFMSYQLGPAQALASAGRLMQEGGAEAVKLEGGLEVAASVRALRQAGIAVMGHLGLTPQSVNALGGYRIQGRSAKDAAKLLKDAKALQEAGAFAVVLEGVPEALAAKATKALSIPTIGIGAGAGCDAQVLVWHDLMAALPGRVPKHARPYEQIYLRELAAVKAWAADVRSGKYPGKAETPA
jgi:3-methyl-2-oxobutanoate hydroxymethyltransferase